MKDTTLRSISIIVWLILAFISMLIIKMHTKLVDTKNQVSDRFSAMDVHLEKRLEYLPDLEEKAAAFEGLEEAVAKVRAARDEVEASSTETERIRGEERLTRTLTELFQAADQSDAGAGDEAFQSLRREFERLDEDIRETGAAYNEAVEAYHARLSFFPSSLVAGMFHFHRMPLFGEAR